jgi:hypothetical protein
MRASIGPLRSQFVFPTVRLAILRANRRDGERFRIVEFSVQQDHVHLIVEAGDKCELSAGMRSVAIRIARYVNELLGRRGRFWADRWFGRTLRSPREVRYALGYVLANFRKHSRTVLPAGIDPYSSAAWFNGFREWLPGSGLAPSFAVRAPPEVMLDSSYAALRAELSERPSAVAHSWLLATGWRRHGLISIAETPRQ